MTKNELAERLERQAKKNMRAAIRPEMTERLLSFGVNPTPLPDDVQEWIVNAIKRPCKFCDGREKVVFPEIRHAFEMARDVAPIFFGSEIVVFAYDLTGVPAYLVDSGPLFDALENNPALISSDGLLLTNRNGCGAFLFDYEFSDAQTAWGKNFVDIFGPPQILQSETLLRWLREEGATTGYPPPFQKIDDANT